MIIHASKKSPKTSISRISHLKVNHMVREIEILIDDIISLVGEFEFHQQRDNSWDKLECSMLKALISERFQQLDL